MELRISYNVHIPGHICRLVAQEFSKIWSYLPHDTPRVAASVKLGVYSDVRQNGSSIDGGVVKRGTRLFKVDEFFEHTQ